VVCRNTAGGRLESRLQAKSLVPLLLSVISLSAATIPADSARGAKLFETLACVQCHSINGQGGRLAPDLGQRAAREFTPASLASTMWNHAPAMWASMSAHDVRAGDLNEQAAADLFAYFYAARFFDKPGDAGRGKQLFASKHCAECHTDVAKLQAIGDPFGLANAMWNHGAQMREEFDKRNLKRPELTSQDLTDILVYVRSLPSARRIETRVELSSGAKGEELFLSKGCAACHTGRLDLPPRLLGKTLTEIAVSMWNHQPRMAAAPPHLELPEMRELLSYLWARQFFSGSGNAAAGARVFTSKHCSSCHVNGPGPKMPPTGRTFSGASMVSALWSHGPRMLQQMNTQKISWPRFDGSQMADLIAFLNTGGTSKP
jgi:mono/diheme cytochrome c family protein